MVNDIYDPLTEYENVFRDRFKQEAADTFAELASEANVDVEANRETCKQIYATEKSLSSVKTRINRWTLWGVLLWLCVVGGIVAAVVSRDELEVQYEVMIGVAAFVVMLYLFMRVYPCLKTLKSERNDLSSIVDQLKRAAWKQMEPLNRLYDWDILTRMISKTVPRLEFDPYFTTQRLADLKQSYNWDDSFNAERSVICSHSGLINGNPFVICRTRKMEWGSETYYGSKTISWTTRERGSDGKYHTVYHSETLRASVTAPSPCYLEKTRLIYGNTAAPDLTFSRQMSGLAGNEKSLSYKMTKRSLRKKARNLSGADFAMLTNEDFEVAFDTSNRNNNQQFALLFTPLAQESMLKLLKDNKVGYGDDFEFIKNKMINVIVPDHLQCIDLDMNPKQYRNFDYDKAKADFYTINAEYFRAVYFALAPLLCVPMYQQIRPQSAIYGNDMPRRSSFWEHEALANFWGQDQFKHPSCVTNCILKTKECRLGDGKSSIAVYAYGYRTVQRLTYVSKYGGDGRWHNVPVYWDEYLPVTGQGCINLQEDNSEQDDHITQRQRLEHIDKVLGQAHYSLYRRHIASKI